MPAIGERIDDPQYAHVKEWTGEGWAPVCPADDVAMTARDGQRRLCCGTCGVPASDVGRRT
jgi:hypothetical protein